MVLLKEINSIEISSSGLWCPPLVSQVTLPNSCDKSTVFLLHWILRLHVQSCKVSCHPLARQESWLERQALRLWPSRLLSHDRVKKTLSIVCHSFEWHMFTSKYFRAQLRSRSTMAFLKIMLLPLKLWSKNSLRQNFLIIFYLNVQKIFTNASQQMMWRNHLLQGNIKVWYSLSIKEKKCTLCV